MNELGLHELLNELDEEDSCCNDTKYTFGCQNAPVKTVADTLCTSDALCSSNLSFNSSTNIRGNEQCTFTSTDTGEAQQTWTYPPIQFKHGMLLSPEEFFLYCCSRTEFPENPFITRHEEKYHNIVEAMKAVYGYQFSSHSIKSYLQRASRNLVKNLGKQNEGFQNGKLWWYYFISNVSAVLHCSKELIRNLLNGETISHQDCNTLQVRIQDECSDANENKIKISVDNIKLNLKSKDMFSFISKEPHWKHDFDMKTDMLHMYHFGKGVGYAKFEIVVGENQQWEFIFEGCSRKVDLSWTGLQSVLETVSDVKLLMSTIEKFKICSALSFVRFDDVTGGPNPYEPLFHTKTYEPAAFCEINQSNFGEKVNWSSLCSFFPPNDDIVYKEVTCDSCKSTANYLRTMRSRKKKQ